MLVHASPLEKLVDALAARNFDRLQAAFAPNVYFRALIPPGTRDANTAAGARDAFETWFGDCQEIELIHTRFDVIGDKVTASYRVRLKEEGELKLCEQHLFAVVGAGGAIECMDLLCSGFRPISRL